MQIDTSGIIKYYVLSNHITIRKDINEMSKDEEEKVCHHPEKLKGKPGDCSPKQVRECHGNDKNHPCNKKR